MHFASVKKRQQNNGLAGNVYSLNVAALGQRCSHSSELHEVNCLFV